jgi:hypothetical protein
MNNITDLASPFMIEIDYLLNDGTSKIYKGQFYARDSATAILRARDYAIQYLRPASIIGIAPALGVTS